MSHLGGHILDTLEESLEDVEGVGQVFQRGLWSAAPSESALVMVSEWAPIEYCIGHSIGFPSVSKYTILLQFFVKHTDAEDGGKIATDTTENIRVMLHTDATLSSALRGISSEITPGVQERVSKWNVLRQRFFQEEQQGVFGFLSNIEIEFETFSS